MPEKRIHNNLHDHTFLPLLPCASFPIAASRPGLWSLPALLQAASDLLCRTPWPWSKAPSDLPNQINDDDERISQPFRPSYMKNLIGEANYEICQERFSTTANDYSYMLHYTSMSTTEGKWQRGNDKGRPKNGPYILLSPIYCMGRHHEWAFAYWAME
ncbi:uncharacterized protein LOC125544981 [Triticum urartu]|uniref:uncharacterized protein LOC125544981 n=1 Tax=Triticum urartu TaxID=4572 RepID=UPI002043B05B|nr:uncharacterized protein LOC125544981 [Triticum urartu]